MKIARRLRRPAISTNRANTSNTSMPSVSNSYRSKQLDLTALPSINGAQLMQPLMQPMNPIASHHPAHRNGRLHRLSPPLTSPHLLPAQGHSRLQDDQTRLWSLQRVPIRASCLPIWSQVRARGVARLHRPHPPQLLPPTDHHAHTTCSMSTRTV